MPPLKATVQAILQCGHVHLQGHQGPVNSLAAHRLSAGILLVSTAADENVHVWECPAANASAAHPPPTEDSASQAAPEPRDGPTTGSWGTWHLRQTIPWGVQLQHCAAVTQLPGMPDWCAESQLARTITKAPAMPHLLQQARTGPITKAPACLISSSKHAQDPCGHHRHCSSLTA